jgi:hypothetical protein
VAKRTTELLKHLKPGDVFVTTAEPIRGGSALSRTVGRVYQKGYKALQGDYSHAGVYVGDGKIMEVDDAGLRHRSLASALARKDAKFLRPAVSDEEREGVVTKLHQMAKDKRDISYASNPFFLKVISKIAIPKGPMDKSHKKEIERKKFICSNFVSNAYEGVASFRDDKPTGYITPKDLHDSRSAQPVIEYKARKKWEA